jgi:hypothetical protein
MSKNVLVVGGLTLLWAALLAGVLVAVAMSDPDAQLAERVVIEGDR